MTVEARIDAWSMLDAIIAESIPPERKVGNHISHVFGSVYFGL